MNFAALLSVVGLLSFLLIIILGIFFSITNKTQYYFILEHLFSMCWIYLLGLILSKGTVASIESIGDMFFQLIMITVSLASAVLKLYPTCIVIWQKSLYIVKHATQVRKQHKK